MNFYEHHIGDYAEATAHLSFIEDAAYSRLIRKYYAMEKPLPTDLKSVERLVAARTPQERAAVKTVLDEFFVLGRDGWHNKRCDEEIDRFKADEPERVVRRANEKGRLKRHREERSRLFADLHTVGQFPLWNIGITELRTLHGRFCNPDNPPETVTRRETGPETPATATQSPVPTSHLPVASRQSPLPSPNPVYEADRARAGTGNDDETEHGEWLIVRELYPPNAARADWIGAEHAARRLVAEGESTWSQLREGVTRYATLCAETNRMVLNPVKFFTDRDRPWSQDWPIPKTPAEAHGDKLLAHLQRRTAGSTP